MKKILITILLLGVLVGGYIFVSKQNKDENGVSKFEIYSHEFAFSSDDIPSINTITGTEEIQKNIKEGVHVSLIKDIAPKSFIKSIKENISSDYVLEEKSTMIGEKEVEYIQLGFASGMRTHQYVFDNGDDVFLVIIHISETESPQNIINTFKFKS